MRVLLIGSGAREHALAFAISRSPEIERLYLCPGNPGTAGIARNLDLNISDFKEIASFAKSEGIDLVVIGPEKPLSDGMADFLRSEGIKVFGPGRLASEIESSKAFAKDLMRRHGIPTAEYRLFGNTEKRECLDYLKKHQYPLVIKASGLAAGKGVFVCQNQEEALQAVDEIYEKKSFGSAGDNVLVEEFMEGQEASVFAVTDGQDYLILPCSQDHKRALDNDRGRNTGGMGAYSPAPLMTESLIKETEETIIKPVLKAMRDEGRPFNGCLYAGLMITEKGPKVVEFNARFGDPETEAVVNVIEGDFLRLLYTSASGKIDRTSVKYNGGSAVTVILASGGYPGKFTKGHEIKGLDSVQDKNIVIFHAGTRDDGGKILTDGGRVLAVTAFTETFDLKNAKASAYRAAGKINFKDKHFRTDISDKAFLP